MSGALAIIPTYLRTPGDLDVTLRTLETLRATAPDVEPLVVDDASPADVLVDELEAAILRLDSRLIRAAENQGFCSPPDEPVLTSRDGYVAIGSLDPQQHGLVGYRADASIVVNPYGGGYRFTAVRRPYRGAMLAIETRQGLARVTPNHGVTMKWKPQVAGLWCVYLMRRGRNWRVGQTQMLHFGRCFGPRMRMKNQDADAVWILSLHATVEDALVEEMRVAWTYCIPTLQFRSPVARGISQARLDDLWAHLPSERAAHAALAAYGRRVDQPYMTRKMGRVKRFPISAVNLMPGYMCVPVPGQAGRRGGYATAFEDFRLDSEPYDGEVVSLEVPPHGHYVSNGIVVHNSATVNIGLREALDSGRDAILVNADVEFFEAGWVERMACQPRQDGEGLAAIVGALLLYPNGLIQHAGTAFSLLHRTFFHRYQFGPGDLPEAQVACVCPVTGALQYIRHSCLVEIGIYDEAFRLGFEDVDYCFRALTAGHDVVYQPTVRAVHHESLFRGQGSEKIQRWQEESWMTFMRKWKDQSFARWVPPM